MRWAVLIMLAIAATQLVAESQLDADFRKESEKIAEACGNLSFKSFPGCAAEFLTEHPLHIAVGSIAPQNGFGAGPAFVAHKTPNEQWRISWDVDAIGASSGSWRAGAYMKIIHTPLTKIIVVHPGASDASSQAPHKAVGKTLTVKPQTVFNIYAQGISLEKLTFFGLGPTTSEIGRSFFSMRQTIVGGNVIKPVTQSTIIQHLSISLLGEIHGRFVDIGGNYSQSSPSIEQLYTEVTAPGLTRQPGFLQLGEGVRLAPTLFTDHLQLNYLGTFQQFIAPSEARYLFRRWTVDLGHEFRIYGRTQLTRPNVTNCSAQGTPCPSVAESARPRNTNGPDECAIGPNDRCPPISYSRNREGTIGLRFLLSESVASAGSVVPFYFQPTLGGSDINGNPALASYQDYRFRGPNLLLFRESFEHSIWGPFGLDVVTDQGKVALTRDDIDFQHFRHSYATGFTVRAGGLPAVFVLFAWGGSEGHHTIAFMNTSLLGGSARPSLQ